jgi:hypothetical protein
LLVFSLCAMFKIDDKSLDIWSMNLIQGLSIVLIYCVFNFYLYVMLVYFLVIHGQVNCQPH